MIDGTVFLTGISMSGYITLELTVSIEDSPYHLLAVLHMPECSPEAQFLFRSSFFLFLSLVVNYLESLFFWQFTSPFIISKMWCLLLEETTWNCWFSFILYSPFYEFNVLFKLLVPWKPICFFMLGRS